MKLKTTIAAAALMVLTSNAALAVGNNTDCKLNKQNLTLFDRQPQQVAKKESTKKHVPTVKGVREG